MTAEAAGGTAAARRQPWRTVALAGVLAAALDIAFTFVFRGREGASPAQLLRGIAGAVLGPSAFTLGSWTVALGAALHFSIAVCAAFVYWAASRRLSVLTRRPLSCGAAFGVAMYLVMHFVVLPLSRLPFRPPALPDVLGDLFSHIVLFGIVIALGVTRAAAGGGQRW